MTVTVDWTPERLKQVLDLIQEGYSAGQIAAKLGIPSRNAIIGKINRDPDLNAAWKAKPKRKVEAPTVAYVPSAPRSFNPYGAFKKAARKADNRTVLRVINNDRLIIEDWLKRNGGPRRFEREVRTDPMAIKHFLEARGYAVEGLFQGKASVKGHGVNYRGTWKGVLRIVDQIRKSEGLEPLMREAS